MSSAAAAPVSGARDYLAVFNALPGANLLLAPELRIVGASDDYLAATLTERATLVGQHIFDAFPDNPQSPEANAVANVRASLAQVLATKQPHELAPQHYDVPDPAQPGHFVERHWQPRHTPVLDAQGQVQFIIQSVQDITARHLAERLLWESRAGELAARAETEQQRTDFQHLLTQAPVAVAVYRGREFRVEMANATTLAIWGRPLAAVLHRPVFEALPEAATPEMVAIFERVFTTGVPHTAYEQPSTIFRHGRPEEVYWNFLFEPQRAPDGRISGLFTIGTEVTAQVLARQQVEQLNQTLEARVQERTAQLTQQQGLLQQILGQVPAAIGTLSGPEHRYTFFNDRYQALSTGRLQLGRSVAEAHPEVVAQGVLDLLDNVYATGQSFSAAERPVQLRNATTDALEQRYLDYIYQPMPNAQGQHTSLLVFALDVTEKVQTRAHTAALQADVLAAAQRQVQERETFYQVFEQTPALIALLRGPSHTVAYHNLAYQRLVPGRALLGRPIAEISLEAVAQGFIALLDKVYQTGEIYFGAETPLELAPAAGGPPQTTYLNFTYQAYQEDGQTVGITVFGYDVTAQVEARHQNDALQADLLAAAQRQADQRALLYQIFEQTPAVVALLRSPAHRYAYVNPAYQALFPGRLLVGRDMAEAVPEMATQGFAALLDGVYQTSETCFGHEQPFTAAPTLGQAPRTGYFDFTYQAYRESGEVVGVAIFATDVSKQVQARQQREAERQQLHALFLDAPAPIVILDGADLVFQLVNPAYQRIFPGRTLLGKPVLEALPEIAGTAIYHSLRGVYDTGQTCVAQELPSQLARHDDGPLEEMFFTFTYQARRNGQGAVDGVLVFAHEVTDQVQARRVVEERGAQARAWAAELAAANAQLTRTNVDLDNFIYTASHDLKHPIANIEGLLQALGRELPPAALVGAVPEMLTLMQLATERFRRTIEQLTEVSKLQQAHSEPLTQVRLAAAVEEVRLDLVPLVQQTRAQLTVEVPPTAHLSFSEKNLRSVVYNLLSNALKYRHPDRPPLVQLTYERQEGFHVLRVQDNGLGFDVAAARAQGKLFGLFQRLHTHVEGSGIGLYMVNRMVENSGGRIEVTSQVGEGTTFTIFFPVDPAS